MVRIFMELNYNTAYRKSKLKLCGFMNPHNFNCWVKFILLYFRCMKFADNIVWYLSPSLFLIFDWKTNTKGRLFP